MMIYIVFYILSMVKGLQNNLKYFKFITYSCAFFVMCYLLTYLVNCFLNGVYND